MEAAAIDLTESSQLCSSTSPSSDIKASSRKGEVEVVPSTKKSFPIKQPLREYSGFGHMKQRIPPANYKKKFVVQPDGRLSLIYYDPVYKGIK